MDKIIHSETVLLGLAFEVVSRVGFILKITYYPHSHECMLVFMDYIAVERNILLL